VRAVSGVGAARWRAVAASTLAAVALAGCTDDAPPPPTPTPTADETTEPAPTGVRIAVVLPPRSDPASVLFADVERQLAELEAERLGDVAGVRAVVPDGEDFVVDVAALLADAGTDLVCVLGDAGLQTVLDLADRFPASRFCAVGEARENQPVNVDVFEVAHEELGHVLGVATAVAVSDAPVGLVLGGDDDARIRRRAGARAALAGVEVSLDGVVTDVAEAAELATAAGDDTPAAIIIDVADGAVGSVLAAAAPAWIAPRGLAIEDAGGADIVRWSVGVDVIVAAALDRLLSGEPPVEGPVALGFAEGLFTLAFAEGVDDAVRAATQVAADELARGVRDPLESRAPRSTG
jgi:basic membrane lipoprotein Med (substrate-binding protein (PBP1-ABC) superfamily)